MCLVGGEESNYEWKSDSGDGNKNGVTKLTLTNVQKDATYTCKVHIDGTWNSKTVSVDRFGKFTIYSLQC